MSSRAAVFVKFQTGGAVEQLQLQLQLGGLPAALGPVSPTALTRDEQPGDAFSSQRYFVRQHGTWWARGVSGFAHERHPHDDRWPWGSARPPSEELQQQLEEEVRIGPPPTLRIPALASCGTALR